MITGPQFEKMVQELSEWYARTRLRLIQDLETPRPYGSVPLSTLEQLQRYQEMSANPDAWGAFVSSLYDRYRGLPEVEELVNRDLTTYVAQMFRLQQRVGLQPSLRGGSY